MIRFIPMIATALFLSSGLAMAEHDTNADTSTSTDTTTNVPAADGSMPAADAIKPGEGDGFIKDTPESENAPTNTKENLIKGKDQLDGATEGGVDIETKGAVDVKTK